MWVARPLQFFRYPFLPHLVSEFAHTFTEQFIREFKILVCAVLRKSTYKTLYCKIKSKYYFMKYLGVPYKIVQQIFIINLIYYSLF